MSSILKNYYRSLLPSINVVCCYESVATDSINSETQGINDCSTCDQLIIVTKSQFSYVHFKKTDNHFQLFEYNIYKQGTIIKLVSNSVQYGVGNNL